MTTRRDLTAFYAVVALIALAGQALAAAEWLGWPLPLAIAAVAALEFGGVVLSRHALQRMQLGERAIAARAASAAVAGFAITFNWLGHSDPRQGGFFAGMSALGYGVWLLDSAARRRDQLRATGMLAEVPPAYGLARWIRHPWLTREARALAVETPALGLHGSVAAAVTARRVARRQAAIAKVLHRKIRAAVDPTTADIAVAVYDLDEVAARLAAGADYDGITALIGADLAPTRIAPAAETNVDTSADTLADADATPAGPDRDSEPPDPTAGGGPANAQYSTADARLMALALARVHPDMPTARIGELVGRSDRTVRRWFDGGDLSARGNGATPQTTSANGGEA